ncbi:DUF3099 domain-containing protein [Tessaracoccus sp. MC1865]|uniref:DUF3099 domain-containing protein n=1 Tax=Tessaracoccus sp. MC1865 TaxID=2760310 RepID=UPI0016043F25|nr:DUF3099 domain-containing protein [Tessaracoccus sp. MC1865]MBB1484885.1 DUF3099 domain-containing protein [Tessaracoccus sp. MC1865]QTO38715.1 DUF3099 domain-containing protein [Tessaracoccus sp. MC1865]
MAKTDDAALITSAGRSRSLDLAERQKRYLITMGVRTALFVAFLIVPGWWKVVTLVLAAVLALAAVLLANQVDHRPPPPAPAEPSADAKSLTAGDVVKGTLEEDDS